MFTFVVSVDYCNEMDMDIRTPIHTRKLSQSALYSSNRHYVDPWDVENYNYIKRLNIIQNCLPTYFKIITFS